MEATEIVSVLQESERDGYEAEYSRARAYASCIIGQPKYVLMLPKGYKIRF
jgi:hypothetical protein